MLTKTQINNAVVIVKEVIDQYEKKTSSFTDNLIKEIHKSFKAEWKKKYAEKNWDDFITVEVVPDLKIIMSANGDGLYPFAVDLMGEVNIRTDM